MTLSRTQCVIVRSYTPSQTKSPISLVSVIVPTLVLISFSFCLYVAFPIQYMHQISQFLYDTGDHLEGFLPMTNGIDTKWMMTLVFIMSMVLWKSFEKDSQQKKQEIHGIEVKIEVLPLGVQIITSNHKSNLNYTFLPHEDIVDVIISEVVLFYKVISSVNFRVLKNADLPYTYLDESSIPRAERLQKEIKSNKMKLVPAFPGLELSYHECEMIWEKLMKALGKIDPQQQEQPL